MTTYLVLVGSDEAAWARQSDAEHQATYDRDEEWATRLAERGHKILGGVELGPSAQARTLVADGATEGPYAESTEWLGGFYLVESDDEDDLVALTRMLTRDGDPVVVRPCTGGGFGG